MWSYIVTTESSRKSGPVAGTCSIHEFCCEQSLHGWTPGFCSHRWAQYEFLPLVVKWYGEYTWSIVVMTHLPHCDRNEWYIYIYWFMIRAYVELGQTTNMKRVLELCRSPCKQSFGSWTTRFPAWCHDAMVGWMALAGQLAWKTNFVHYTIRDALCCWNRIYFSKMRAVWHWWHDLHFCTGPLCLGHWFFRHRATYVATCCQTASKGRFWSFGHFEGPVVVPSKQVSSNVWHLWHWQVVQRSNHFWLFFMLIIHYLL